MRNVKCSVVMSAVLAVTVSVTTLPAHAAMGDCGQPFSDGADPTTTDALIVLQAAVRLIACLLCVCDVDGNGIVAATDALSVLKIATNQELPLLCPPCSSTTTSTTTSVTTTTTTSTTTTTLPPPTTTTTLQSGSCYDDCVAEFDDLMSVATVGVDFSPGCPSPVNVSALGPVRIKLADPVDPGDGKCTIETEIVAMQLAGSGGVSIVEAPGGSDPMDAIDPPCTVGGAAADGGPGCSPGAITQQTAGTDFAADSFFDVFVEIDVIPGTMLFNKDPFRMSATINEKPPIGAIYTSPGTCVDLFDVADPSGPPVAYLAHVSHDVSDPPEQVVPLPCDIAFAPRCDGECLPGQFCQDFGESCACQAIAVPPPCGDAAGPPQCWGACPPTQPVCRDFGGTCGCAPF